MARIRSVHPGLFTDEGFVSCGPLSRLLVIGLWTECDDYGVFEWKPVTIKMRLLPVDNADVSALLAELEANNLVRRFTANGKQYGAVRNFCRYQRPKKPKSHHPLPAEIGTYVASTGAGGEPDASEEGDGGELVEPEPARVPPKSEPVPPKSEIAPQMEDGGWRMEGKKEPPPPTPAKPDTPRPDDPAVAVVKTFMAERERRWPDAMPATIAMTQLQHAAELLRHPGATVELVCELVRQGVAEWANPVPPSGVGAFRKSIPNRIAQHQRAVSGGGKAPLAVPAEPVVFDPNARFRTCLRAYAASGTWPSSWGPEPGDPHCQIPAALIAEVLPNLAPKAALAH